MNDLLKKLEEEGKRKASELLSSWEKKKKERMSELEKELDSYREGREKYYSLKGEREKNGLLSSSRMALKKKTLLEKRKIFEDLFVKMSAEFFRFHDERYYAFLDRYTGELPAEAELLLGSQERISTREWLKKKEVRCRDKGRADDFEYGFRLLDGRNVYMYDFRTLLRSFFKKKENGIAERLWKS